MIFKRRKRNYQTRNSFKDGHILNKTFQEFGAFSQQIRGVLPLHQLTMVITISNNGLKRELHPEQISADGATFITPVQSEYEVIISSCQKEYLCLKERCFMGILLRYMWRGRCPKNVHPKPPRSIKCIRPRIRPNTNCKILPGNLLHSVLISPFLGKSLLF